MRQTRLSLAELGVISATRGILGVGIGLLLSSRLDRDQRITIGSALAAFGALSTIPLAIRMVRRQRASDDGKSMPVTPAYH